MDLEEERERIGSLLDAYADSMREIMTGELKQYPEDAGVPAEMQDGPPLDDFGTVRWRLLPTKLEQRDIEALEDEIGCRIPAALVAYLLARTHLFDQMQSRRHGQLVLMSSTPSDGPLGPFRRILAGWRPLTAAGYIPFAEWGDGWGPMCLDVGGVDASESDAPVVWFDHERLHHLGFDGCSDRPTVSEHCRPLYSSFTELIEDLLRRS